MEYVLDAFYLIQLSILIGELKEKKSKAAEVKACNKKIKIGGLAEKTVAVFCI